MPGARAEKMNIPCLIEHGRPKEICRQKLTGVRCANKGKGFPCLIPTGGMDQYDDE